MDTYRLARDLDFDHSYSFIYSRRPGTPAAELADETPLEVKKERLARFQTLIKNSALEKSKAMEGTVQRVLVESVADRSPGKVLASSFNARTVQFEAPAQLIGQFVDVRINKALTMHLLDAELVTK